MKISNGFLTLLKIIGWCLLISHFFTTPLIFNVWGVFKYFLIVAAAVILGFLYDALRSLFSNVRRSLKKKKSQTTLDLKSSDISNQISPEEDKSTKFVLSADEWLKKNFYQVLLIPGEDGLFLLPLLYIGVNFFTAFISSAIFGLLHLPVKNNRDCFFQFFINFLTCFFVLPHGILCVIVGHLLRDALGLSVAVVIAKWYRSKS